MSGDQVPLAVLDNGPHEYVEVLTGLALLNQSFESLRGDLAELRVGMTQTLSELQRRNELTQEGLNRLRIEHTARSGLLDRTVEDVNRLYKRIAAIERLIPVLRAVMWLGAALGVSVMALIWAMITGQAQVIFIR
jgi:hypothetical protein